MSRQSRKNFCILTFDVEEWYHGAYPGYDYSMVADAPVRVVEMVERIVSLLRGFGAGATFFVLGEVAERHPQVVRTIAGAGFEVASHSYTHTLVPPQGKTGFAEQLVRSKCLLEDLSGQSVVGFRAPNFSISPQETPWAFEVLEGEGFLYDSSVFPAVAYYGGNPGAPRFIHKIGNLVEFPPSAASVLGVRLAFSGGFYFRALPLWLIEAGIKSYHRRGETPVLYLHPKDIDPHTPPLPLGWIANLVHRGRAKSGLAKFVRLLEKYRFISIREFLDISR